MDVKRGYKQLVTLTKRVKYVMTYKKENTNMNEHRRVIVKLNNKNISKSAYRDSWNRWTAMVLCVIQSDMITKLKCFKSLFISPCISLLIFSSRVLGVA